MRGKEFQLRFWKPVCGITPAHAGKSWTVSIFAVDFEDHPRTCGEKPFSKASPFKVSGSPPHMRGKGYSCGYVSDLLRITPAHAGKRTRCQRPSFVVWDHPRTCGEKQKLLKVSPDNQGSPPHMRGKESFDKIFVLFIGITPAHAGKSRNF